MMGKGKWIARLLVLFAISTMVSCENSSKEEVKIDLFDSQKALSISKEYLFNIKEGNIDGANKLCSEELLKENKNLGEGISDITSFDKYKIVEGKDYGYYIYNVIRTSQLEPKSDLEECTIKISKENDNYFVTEVKSESKKELYVRDRALRILENQGGNSNLVLTLDSLPKDTYSSENKIMLYKSKVPNDNFGKVGLSFSGKKVAISTKNDTDMYLCVANIEDSVTTMVDDSSASNKILENSELEELFEKPIAKKIIPLDLLKSSTIDNFVFSKKEDSLAVVYINSFGNKSTNIYNANDGNILSGKLKAEFSEEKFNVEGISFNEEKFIFNVSSTTNEFKEKEGKYSYNIETEEIIKL